MAAQKIQLIGYWLPPGVECFSLGEALGFLATKLKGVFQGDAYDETPKAFANILLTLVNHGFCQAFIIPKFDNTRNDAKELYEVPYAHHEPSEGKYLLTVSADATVAHCGDYSGELVLPADSFRSGFDVFRMKWLAPEGNAENKTARMYALVALAGAMKNKSERLNAIQAVLKEAEIRAQEMGKPFDKRDMPGIKNDFTSFLKTRFKGFGRIADATFHDYYKECGLKFNPGRRFGEEKIWEELFPS